jgi:hypothetical protein
MAVIVEDGTGKADANSYASEAEADAYIAARGDPAWGALQASEKSAALIRATDYMRGYMHIWKGVRAVSTQALDWPRRYVYDFDGTLLAENVLPLPVKTACIELAHRAAAGPLTIEPEYDASGRLPTKIVKKVGPIDKELTYPQRGPLSNVVTRKRFPEVDALITRYLRMTAGVYR